MKAMIFLSRVDYDLLLAYSPEWMQDGPYLATHRQWSTAGVTCDGDIDQILEISQQLADAKANMPAKASSSPVDARS